MHLRRILASAHNGRITVYQAADLAPQRTLPRVSSLTVCFRPASCTSAMTSFRRWSWSLCLAPSLPLMVWLRCRFVRAATALSITQSFFARMPLLSLWLLAFLFVWISSFASATLSTLCFSTSSRQPSSLSGPSPRISTAGAYCVSLFLHPSVVGGFEVRTPRGVSGRWRSRTACSSETLQGIITEG